MRWRARVLRYALRHRARRADRRLRPAATCEESRSDAAGKCVATKIQALHVLRSSLRERHGAQQRFGRALFSPA
jgi:hypothetical protein